MRNWDEVRSAYFVVKLGTVSAAANALGVHRATIIRHIDTLEAELGEKLFQRHARGYTPTEAGLDLMRVAQATDEQFNHFATRTMGRSSTLSGELIVTALGAFAGLLMEPIRVFQEQYPDVSVRMKSSERLFQLEFGEAHVALRAGSKPDQPDNVVRKFAELDVGFYASPEYVAKNGLPKTPEEFIAHRFVGPDNQQIRAPLFGWFADNIPEDSVKLRFSDEKLAFEAIRNGDAIGYMQVKKATNAGLIEVIAPRPEWRINIWLVTHVDLHRTAKVQAFLQVLRDTVPAPE